MADSYEFMIRRVVGDPRACGLSVCRTLYDLVSGAMRYRHGAQEGIYDEHGNPRVAIVRKIKAINSALHDYVMHPHSDADLAEYETSFLDRIALSRQPAMADSASRSGSTRAAPTARASPSYLAARNPSSSPSTAGK